MTPQEFKAWFDGFTEAFEGRIPTKAQWKRIQERVAEVDGKPVTERVYVDRYWPGYVPTFPVYRTPGTYWTTCTTNAVNPYAHGSAVGSVGGAVASFNSLSAMNDLGRAEASNLGAA